MAQLLKQQTVTLIIIIIIMYLFAQGSNKKNSFKKATQKKHTHNTKRT